MRDLIKREIKKYLTEAKTWVEDHCDNAFAGKEERYFCYAITNEFKKNYKFQEGVKNKFKNFVLNNTKLSSVNMEILKKDSPISEEGFKEFKWVSDHGQELCSGIRKNMIKTYQDLLDGKHELYLDKSGNYHIINRLDTNYSALGIMFTEYFVNSDLIYSLIMRRIKYKSDFERAALYFINKILNPQFSDENLDRVLGDIELGENPLNSMFIDLIKEQQTPHLIPKTIKVLEKVRETGFGTEKKFMKLLDEYGIEYKNFGKDYGFVDRFLGIDLFVKIKNLWVPAQIKSSKQEKTLIDSLGCDAFLEVYQKDGEFFVNNAKFERFFCDLLDICKDKVPNNSSNI